jgi:hypothetical protein
MAFNASNGPFLDELGVAPQCFLKASYGIDEIEQIANKIARMMNTDSNDDHKIISNK